MRAIVFVPLKPLVERRNTKGHSATDIVARLTPKLFMVPGAIVVAFEPPAIQGIGSYGGFQFELSKVRAATPLKTLTSPRTRSSGPAARARICPVCSPASPRRSAASVTIDRRESEGNRRSVYADLVGAQRLHGLALRERLRVQDRSYRVYVQADPPFRMPAQDPGSSMFALKPTSWCRWMIWSRSAKPPGRR